MSRSETVRILVVEDDVATRELIREHLELDPRLEIVAESGDGAEGVELARRKRPQIVLMDLSLPRMDGLRAAELIRRDVPGTRVIVLTNYGFRDLHERTRESHQTLPSDAVMGKHDIGPKLLGLIHHLAGGSVRTL